MEKTASLHILWLKITFTRIIIRQNIAKKVIVKNVGLEISVLLLIVIVN